LKSTTHTRFDRRDNGRSSQPWNGDDLDTYADDLAETRQKLGRVIVARPAAYRLPPTGFNP
jgi:hypothetical protein